MAQLDKFLGLLTQPGVHELKLASNAPPVFFTDEGPRPASSARPATEQLLALLAEVVDAGTLETMRQAGEARGTVERPGSAPCAVHLVFHGTQLEASFRAVSQDAPAPRPAPVPVAPATPAPAPAAASRPASPSASAPPSASASASAFASASTSASAPPAPAPPVTTAARPVTTLSDGHPIDMLFRAMWDLKASDLHLSSGDYPMVRKDGEMVRMEQFPPLTADSLAELVAPITPERNAEEFEACHDTDFAYEIEGLARFRCNLFADRKGPGAVFRVIPSKILTAEQLGLSPHILELCKLTKGLVLVTGPTGSGKSTTLTAMIDHVNTIRHDHIITIEDPIEFVHENRNCLVNQREVSTHTGSFKRALRAALREDPDIVLVGEMRDLETIAIAIETAETGHLVFGTLHTTTAVSTVDRIIDQFPADQQAQVRTMLSEALKGVISQCLCKKVGGGRVAALEVLMGIPSVANLIREGKTFQIASIMQTGKKYGMVTLNDALVDLVKKNLITPEEANLRAVDKTGLAAQLKQLQEVRA